MSSRDETHILLVEDNRHDAELTVRALNKHNLANHLVHVKDGAEALDWLFGRGAYVGRDINCYPKVILLDLKLPKMGGLEVLKAIRVDERYYQIPVVVLTSSKEEQDIVRSYSYAVNSYIIKPVDYEEFTSTVADVGYYWSMLNTVPR
ncbi:MAG TPA: response regulator [Methylophilaceae bacterium]|jgi:CheY-like chemotaxis protein